MRRSTLYLTVPGTGNVAFLVYEAGNRNRSQEMPIAPSLESETGPPLPPPPLSAGA